MKQRARRTALGALALITVTTNVCLGPSYAQTNNPSSSYPLAMGVDRDDDDADGRPDNEQENVSPSNDLVEIPLPDGADRVVALEGNAVRLLVDGKPLAVSRIGPKVRHLHVQGVRPGQAELKAFGRTYAISVLEVRLIDGQGNEVDPARSHASFERTPPERIQGDPPAKNSDPDALRYVVIAHPNALPPLGRFYARDAEGTAVDILDQAAFVSVACPNGTPAGLACGSTAPIRVVPDDIDRSHPSCSERSIRAELGGVIELVLTTTGRRLVGVRVGGPRQTPQGPIVRYRARLRVFLVRPMVGGPPPVGADDQAALRLAKSEVGKANALWAGCGVGFGAVDKLDMTIVDPPRTHLVAFGCDQGLSAAAGGVVRMRVDGRDVSAPMAAGVTPAGAARVFAAALSKAGFTARVSDNAPIASAVGASSDVLVRRRTGEPALVEPPVTGPVSSDARLTVCLGRVDLQDGLQHFGDVDAIAGTVEERSLIKAFDDGDPSTIEIFVVPAFAGGGRIGESFIGADGGSIRNVIIEDRAGFRADRASFALAHELGHVLLDEPGHPDDFGRDTPSRLMDADAANGTAFGPRRLLVEECARVLRQSGPSAPVPLLRPWPFSRIGQGD